MKKTVRRIGLPLVLMGVMSLTFHAFAAPPQPAHFPEYTEVAFQAGEPSERSLDLGSFEPETTVWDDWVSLSGRARGACHHWYARSEMLALFRNADNGVPFASIGPAGPVALGTSDFRTEFDAGLRVLIGRTLGNWYRLEGLWFGSYSWDSSAAVNNLDANTQAGVGNLFSPFSAFGNPAGVVGLDFNEFASIRIQSKLNNGELNLRQKLSSKPGLYETSLLIGGRYMDIRERFGYFTQSSVPGAGLSSNDVDIQTTNRLIGFQAGMLHQFILQGHAWVDFEMKGGIFDNQVRMNRTYTVVNPAGATTAFPGTDSQHRTSFVGELSLQLNYRFANAWTFYAGYNAIWVTGVALASENFDTNDSNLVFGPTLVKHAGEVVYHGPNVGLTFVY